MKGQMVDISKPIFVVGAPRSGTTMLAAMLAAHNRFAAGPETQFFSKLPMHVLEAAASSEWPEKAVDCIMSLTLAEQSVAALFGTNAREIAAFLSKRPPSVSAMLESLTVPFAKERGKEVWVEKTPNHILNLPDIRRLWPNARIIRIIRDPRDVGLSMCKLPTFSNCVLANIYLWLQWNMAAEPFFEADPMAMTVRYESILEAPIKELEGLCTFLGESFDPAMLDFSKTAADVSSAAETWKKPVAGGLNADRKFAWKASLPEDISLVSNVICHEYLKIYEYDYEDCDFVTKTAYRLSADYVERFERLLIKDVRRGVRWLPAAQLCDADKVIDNPPYRNFRTPYWIAKRALNLIIDRVRLRL